MLRFVTSTTMNKSLKSKLPSDRCFNWNAEKKENSFCKNWLPHDNTVPYDPRFSSPDKTLSGTNNLGSFEKYEARLISKVQNLRYACMIMDKDALWVLCNWRMHNYARALRRVHARLSVEQRALSSAYHCDNWHLHLCNTVTKVKIISVWHHLIPVNNTSFVQVLHGSTVW